MDAALAYGKIGGMAEMTFRDKMLAALEEGGMTMAELSRRSGVSYDTLAKLKRREGASTSADSAKKIADALGFAVEKYGPGFSDPQPKMDMGAIINDADPALPKNTASDEINEFKIAQVGNLVQVAGTYDKEGLLKLAKRLEAMSEWLD